MSASTPTNKLTRDCIKWLTLHGYLAWRSNQVSPRLPDQNGKPVFRKFTGLRGVPDIIAISSTGQFVGVEIKTGTDRLSIYQQSFMLECIDRNAFYIVVRESTKELEKVLLP